MNFPSFPCVLTFMGSLAIISPLRYCTCGTLERRLFKGANILNCSSRLTFLKHVSVRLHGRPVSFVVPSLQSCFFSYASCPPEKVKKKTDKLFQLCIGEVIFLSNIKFWPRANVGADEQEHATPILSLYRLIYFKCR